MTVGALTGAIYCRSTHTVAYHTESAILYIRIKKSAVKQQFTTILCETNYRVRQNKISELEKSRYIYNARMFLHKIFHIYLPHMSSQVCLILLS